MNGLLRRCADLRITLLGVAALAGAVGIGAYRPEGVLPWVTAPISLLALNLIAAIAVDPRFRRRAPLLGFHLCLLAVVVLGVVGHLIRFTGSVELARGQAFDPAAVRVEEQGLWHHNRLDRIRFQQGPVIVRYGPGLRRLGTESEVQVEAGGLWATIGDPGPLLIEGYRFYPTSNKGFAAYLSWRGRDNQEQHGTVHFPSFPLLAEALENRWRLPGGKELVLTLDPDLSIPEATPWVLRGSGPRPQLLVYVDGRSIPLQLGAELTVAKEVIRFDGVGLWMGYWIYSEMTMTWLLAAACLGVFFIGWHYWALLRFDPRLVPGRSVAREGGG